MANEILVVALPVICPRGKWQPKKPYHHPPLLRGTHMIEKLYKIAAGLNKRFPDGNDPFMIVTRLAEECGEVASEVNHFERKGVKALPHGEPDRKKFAKEIQDIMRAVLHLTMYYGLEEELAASVEEYYQRVVDEGLVDPI